MNKTLKFQRHLAAMIKQNEKTTTWRLFDDKNLQSGDIIDLVDSGSLEKFATAKLTEVIEKDFAHLDDSDWEGHEKFSTASEMYETYTEMYKQPITPQTMLKIIKFELL